MHVPLPATLLKPALPRVMSPFELSETAEGDMSNGYDTSMAAIAAMAAGSGFPDGDSSVASNEDHSEDQHSDMVRVGLVVRLLVADIISMCSKRSRTRRLGSKLHQHQEHQLAHTSVGNQSSLCRQTCFASCHNTSHWTTRSVKCRLDRRGVDLYNWALELSTSWHAWLAHDIDFVYITTHYKPSRSQLLRVSALRWKSRLNVHALRSAYHLPNL